MGNLKCISSRRYGPAPGKVCGLEALSRWHDSEKGLLMPGEYIPMLERDRPYQPAGLLCGRKGNTAHCMASENGWAVPYPYRSICPGWILDVSDPVMEVERLGSGL